MGLVNGVVFSGLVGVVYPQEDVVCFFFLFQESQDMVSTLKGGAEERCAKIG